MLMKGCCCTLVVVSPPVETQVCPKILSYLRMESREYWLVSRKSWLAASFLLMAAAAAAAACSL